MGFQRFVSALKPKQVGLVAKGSVCAPKTTRCQEFLGIRIVYYEHTVAGRAIGGAAATSVAYGNLVFVVGAVDSDTR